jgi:hypothetical protein
MYPLSSHCPRRLPVLPFPSSAPGLPLVPSRFPRLPIPLAVPPGIPIASPHHAPGLPLRAPCPRASQSPLPSSHSLRHPRALSVPSPSSQSPPIFPPPSSSPTVLPLPSLSPRSRPAPFIVPPTPLVGSPDLPAPSSSPALPSLFLPHSSHPRLVARRPWSSLDPLIVPGAPTSSPISLDLLVAFPVPHDVPVASPGSPGPPAAPPRALAPRAATGPPTCLVVTAGALVPPQSSLTFRVPPGSPLTLSFPRSSSMIASPPAPPAPLANLAHSHGGLRPLVGPLSLPPVLPCVSLSPQPPTSRCSRARPPRLPPSRSPRVLPRSPGRLQSCRAARVLPHPPERLAIPLALPGPLSFPPGPPAHPRRSRAPRRPLLHPSDLSLPSPVL